MDYGTLMRIKMAALGALPEGESAPTEQSQSSLPESSSSFNASPYKDSLAKDPSLQTSPTEVNSTLEQLKNNIGMSNIDPSLAKYINNMQQATSPGIKRSVAAGGLTALAGLLMGVPVTHAIGAGIMGGAQQNSNQAILQDKTNTQNLKSLIDYQTIKGNTLKNTNTAIKDYNSILSTNQKNELEQKKYNDELQNQKNNAAILGSLYPQYKGLFEKLDVKTLSTLMSSVSTTGVLKLDEVIKNLQSQTKYISSQTDNIYYDNTREDKKLDHQIEMDYKNLEIALTKLNQEERKINDDIATGKIQREEGQARIELIRTQRLKAYKEFRLLGAGKQTTTEGTDKDGNPVNKTVTTKPILGSTGKIINTAPLAGKLPTKDIKKLEQLIADGDPQNIEAIKLKLQAIGVNPKSIGL